MRSACVLTRDEDKPGNPSVYSSNIFQFEKKGKNVNSDSGAKDLGVAILDKLLMSHYSNSHMAMTRASQLA